MISQACTCFSYSQWLERAEHLSLNNINWTILPMLRCTRSCILDLRCLLAGLHKFCAAVTLFRRVCCFRCRRPDNPQSRPHGHDQSACDRPEAVALTRPLRAAIHPAGQQGDDCPPERRICRAWHALALHLRLLHSSILWRPLLGTVLDQQGLSDPNQILCLQATMKPSCCPDQRVLA